MNDEQRLSEDELAAIVFTLEKASPGEWSTDGIQIFCDNQPIALMAVNDHAAGNALLFIRATRFMSDLLQHTRALENELHIERAQKYYDAYWKAKWTGTLEEFLTENPEPPQPGKEHLRLYYELHSTMMQVYEWLTGERPEFDKAVVMKIIEDVLALMPEDTQE